MDINLITGTGKQTIEAIKYLLKQLPDRDEIDDIVETLDLLSADMLDAQDDIGDLQTATGNLSTAVGTNTSDIGALDTRVTALEQGGSKKKLAEFDFTESLEDSVSETLAVMSGSVARDSSGIVFSGTGKVDLTSVLANFHTYEIKFGDFTYLGDTAETARLLMSSNPGYSVEQGLLLWRGQSQQWGMYWGTWTMFPGLTSFEDIKNKTIKFEISGRNASVYVDDVLVTTTSGANIDLNKLKFYLGSVASADLNGVIVESFKAY